MVCSYWAFSIFSFYKFVIDLVSQNPQLIDTYKLVYSMCVSVSSLSSPQKQVHLFRLVYELLANA